MTRKTKRLDFDLMPSTHVNKQFIYNESLLKIDSLMNLTVESFINDEFDPHYNPDKTYIVNSGKNKNHILYKNIGSDQPIFFLPKKDFLVYVNSESQFYFFNGEEWKIALIKNSNPNSSCYNYLSIKGNFSPSSNIYQNLFQYLYLDGDVNITFNNIALNKFTLIIKQNVKNIYSIKWSSSILFPNNYNSNIRLLKNTIHVFTFYKLPESFRYLMSVELNYKY